MCLLVTMARDEIFLFLVAIVSSSFALHLPSYITPCHKDDPNLGKCISDQANVVMPRIIKGDKDYNFPPLHPLTIPEVSLKAGNNFNLKLKNVVVDGFDSAVMFNVTFDWSKSETDGFIRMDELTLVADYDIAGKILMLPIFGNGVANISVVKPVFYIHWKLSIVKRKGVDYVKVVESKLSYDLQGATFHFDNLFNGNKQLGDQMNKVLNDNWEVLQKEFSPAIANVINEIVDRTGRSVINKVPVNEFFV